MQVPEADEPEAGTSEQQTTPPETQDAAAVPTDQNAQAPKKSFFGQKWFHTTGQSSVGGDTGVASVRATLFAII